MTIERVETGISNPARLEAERIAAANGGSLAMSREQAAEILKAQGILPPGEDGKPVYTAPDNPELARVLADPDVSEAWKAMLRSTSK